MNLNEQEVRDIISNYISQVTKWCSNEHCKVCSQIIKTSLSVQDRLINEINLKYDDFENSIKKVIKIEVKEG